MTALSPAAPCLASAAMCCSYSHSARGACSKWGAVVDIYFPGKKGQTRVNYCFVTFDSWRAAQRACNESERSICGQVNLQHLISTRSPARV